MDFFSKYDQIMVTFTEEIHNGKLHFYFEVYSVAEVYFLR